MPRIRRFKRRFKRRRPRRRRRKKKSSLSMLVNRSLTVMPDKYMCRMRYGNIVPLVPASTFVSIGFTLNNIISIEGTSQKPMGFDELTSLYSKYVVTGSSIVVQCVNNSNAGLTCVLIPTRDIGFSTFDEATQQPYAKTISIGSNEGMDQRSLKGFMKTTTLAGKKVMQDDLFQGDAATPSPIGFNWVLFFNSSNNTSNVNVDITFQMVYYVTWLERLALIPS